MIPLRDLNPTRRRPVAVYSLLAVNVSVYLFWALDGSPASFVYRFGVVPHLLATEPTPGSWITPVTSMFLHGGFWHLLGNMWFLHIFGDNVEDVLGHPRFLAFYFACGLLAVVGQVVIDPSSKVPMVGASGAISGVLAGYVTLFSRAKILTLIPIFFFFQLVELPAVFFIFLWFGYQLLLGLLSLGTIGQNTGGVAFFAHIGGFVGGLVLIRLMRRVRPGLQRRARRF